MEIAMKNLSGWVIHSIKEFQVCLSADDTIDNLTLMYVNFDDAICDPNLQIPCQHGESSVYGFATVLFYSLMTFEFPIGLLVNCQLFNSFFYYWILCPLLISALNGLAIDFKLQNVFLKSSWIVRIQIIIWILTIDFNWLDQSPTRKVFNCYLIKVKECHILKDSFVLEHYLTRTVNLFHFDISTLQA